jgi:DNA end-binding protein Ku
MVTIPVRLYSAAQSKDVSFHLLHREDNARIRNRRWCPVEDKEVPADEIVRGYEVSKGEYVTLEDEDFDKLPVPSKHTLDIVSFVEAEDIPPTYYERAYYLEPEELGIKSYRLLMKALEKRELVAIGKIAFRQREHLCALRPVEGVLVCETLFYADEVREEPKVPDATVSEKELEMADSLIELLRDDFDPKKYEDDYRKAILELVEAKKEGREVAQEAAEPEAKVVDLMAALKASIDAATKGEKERPKKPARSGSRSRRKAS